MPSTETLIELSEQHKRTLLLLARQSIEFGLKNGKCMQVNVQNYDAPLRNQGCCFVTLQKQGQLCGCIGALSPFQALVLDVIEHAFAAAFEDLRFNPVTQDEFNSLHIEISVLTPQTPILCHSKQELLAQLQPEVDGIVIEDKHYRATFLPTVWEKLPNRRDFLQQLMRKAGMPENYWSDSLKAYRYHTISFGE